MRADIGFNVEHKERNSLLVLVRVALRLASATKGLADRPGISD
jgi:hypothetical protein